MADVITGTQYSTLATQIGTVISVVANSQSYLYSALQAIAAISDVDPTYDLIVPFKNVYDIQVSVLESTSNYQQAARALNSHVLLRARQSNGNTYTDINDWFDDEGLANRQVAVPQSWADLCSTTGTTIDESYID
jgi:hypothetical protein